MKAPSPCSALFLTALVTAAAPALRAAEPPAASVAAIQAKHDRALIRELSEYLNAHPRANDRDQAYAALFNKAIEHDWFAEVEDLGRQYLKTDPNGPVKALAQIVQTMARAQAGRYDQALPLFVDLVKNLHPTEQEEFALSFADSFAAQAIAAGEYKVARQTYATLLDRFSDSPDVRRKVQGELKRLDLVGRTAPMIDARDIQGRSVKSESFRGKYVLIDFWATWCGPCVAELPRLQAAYQTYHNKGLEIVGISLDESREAVVDFVKARKVPWTQIHDAATSGELVRAFGLSAIPATYLIDPEGTIIRLDLRGQTLDDTLARLFKR